MGKLLNSRWWVGYLTLLEALAGGAFDYPNCLHSRKFDHHFSKKYGIHTLQKNLSFTSNQKR